MKKYTPKLVIEYLLKEFSKTLLIFFGIFISLILFTSFVEELIFFREKNIQEDLYLKTFVITLIKIPSLLINFSPFIFLFSGIFFFVKIKRNNEISPLNLSGFSNTFVALVPSFFALAVGLVLIFLITPISSSLLRYYEVTKQKLSSNDNLIIVSNNGIWVKENFNNSMRIIRSDNVQGYSFNVLKNITIHSIDFNKKDNLRIEAKEAIIKTDHWLLKKVTKYSGLEIEKIDNEVFETNIDFKKLKMFFINSDIFSIWNISSELKEIQKSGYYGSELIIRLNKYLSLPFELFSMILISTFFTIKNNFQFNNFIYAFIGVLVGIMIYFFGDLSIALGKSGKLPLVFSVWVPVITVMTLSIYSLLRPNE